MPVSWKKKSNCCKLSIYVVAKALQKTRKLLTKQKVHISLLEIESQLNYIKWLVFFQYNNQLI